MDNESESSAGNNNIISEMPFEYYFIFGFFIFIIVLCFLLMYRMLDKGICKLESCVMIYYFIFIVATFDIIYCLYLSKYESLALLDIINSLLHYIILSLVLNLWFRLTLGTKNGKRSCYRIFLNFSNIIIILYIILIILCDIWITELGFENLSFYFEISNGIACILFGIFSFLWLLWRPFACCGMKICQSDDNVNQASKSAIKKLFVILLIVSICMIFESIVIFYNNFDQFDKLLYLDYIMSYITEYFISIIGIEYGYNSKWRFSLYCIDLLILSLILLFYIPITWYSFKNSSIKQKSQFSFRFGYNIEDDDNIDDIDLNINMNDDAIAKAATDPNIMLHIQNNGHRPGEASKEIEMKPGNNNHIINNNNNRLRKMSSVNDMIIEFKRDNRVVDSNEAKKLGMKRVSNTFWIVLFELFVLLFEDLLCLFYYDTNQFDDRLYFWILFGYTVITNYLQICGLTNKSFFKTFIFVFIEAAQAILYSYLTQNCYIIWGITSYYMFCGIFIVQTCVRLLIWCIKKDENTNQYQENISKTLTIARCIIQIYVAFGTIPLIYFAKISPFRQLWYDVLYTVNLWMTISMYDILENILDHTVSNENLEKLVLLANERFNINVLDETQMSKLNENDQKMVHQFIDNNLNRLQNDNNFQKFVKILYGAIQLTITVIVIVAQIDYFTYVEADYDRGWMIFNFVCYGLMVCCGGCACCLKALQSRIES